MNGDYIHASGGGQIINRSLVYNSFNGLEKRYDDATVQALVTLEKAVRETGDEEANELFETFAAEIKSEKPKPAVAKALLEAALSTVPKIAAVTAAVAQIHSAIS